LLFTFGFCREQNEVVVDSFAMLKQRQLLIFGRSKREMETPVWKVENIKKKDGKQLDVSVMLLNRTPTEREI
jgi:hypothetical protein